MLTPFARNLCILLAALAAIAMGGCQSGQSEPRTPCQIMKDNRWTCNLEIVDDFKPGQLILVRDGVFQPLPLTINPPVCNPSNAVREFGQSSWNLGLDVALPQIPGLSAVADAKAAVAASGAKKVDISFPKVEICSLKPGEDGTSLAQIERAKVVGQAYLDALSLPNRNIVGNAAGQPGAKVLLVLQTLNATVDATVHHESGFSTDVGATIRGIKGEVTGGHERDRTLEFKYPTALPVGYRALPVAFERSPLEGAVRLDVTGATSFVTVR